MSFFTEVIRPDPRYNSTDECRDPLLLEPVTRAAVENIIKDAANMGITLRISETFRSPARQKMMYDKGTSQLENIGVHTYGLACDFFKLVDGKASWSGDWSFLRDLAEKHGLISGLDWGLPLVRHNFIDPDHVQRVSVSEQESLFAGTYYPSSNA